ncbi:MAG: Rpn family recombination-promoting nuclease/putative transposase [Lachnospiraceae bacterium]|nr:Rpn family recombination-promoting nuclease/putative transposase [Lachnospiraceae bacterium]
MILRKVGYVGAAYREQYDGKMKDAYYPVNEFVLYWGKERWTVPNSLKDSLSWIISKREKRKRSSFKN